MVGQLSEEPSVVTVIRRHAREAPDKDAVVLVADPDRPDRTISWSYRVLDEQARAVAVWLGQRYEPGSRILLLYPLGLGFVAAFLGCLYSGMIAVPAPLPGRYRHHRRRVRTIAMDAEVSVILTDSASLDEVREWSTTEGVGQHCVATDATAPARHDAWTAAPVTPETLALLQYTSGSTGDAKGVMITNGNLLHNVEAFTRSVGWGPRTRSGGWIPLYHDMGLSGHLLPALLCGSTCVLLQPMAFLRKPVAWLRTIDAYDLTMSSAPNFAFDLCARKVTDEQAERLDLSRWEFAANGSEPVRASVLAAFAKRFARSGFRDEALAPCYGLAEATVYVSGRAGRSPTVRRVDAERAEHGEFVTEPVAGGSVREVVGCGPVPDYDLRVVDPITRRVLPQGRIGEIWLRGPSVARGYWRRTDATRRTFAATTADGDTGYLRTGDLGVLHEGELYVHGRIKEMLIVHGRNLYPHDIEHELRVQHPELGAVGAVFAVPSRDEDEPDAERVIVTHEARGVRGTERLAELAAAMRLTIAREFGFDAAAVVLLRPGGVRRTTSGKIQRSAMRELFLAEDLRPLYSDAR